ncbi:MAG: gas vesicle protein GvpN [Planctomycetota bacterium]|nr:gas vesicle protein GvpN [Planctomycetota bacterium]
MSSTSTLRAAPRRNSASGLLLEPSESFVDTPAVSELTERALTYLSIGYPVHLAGPAGTGKTTLAFHIAARLGRPVSLLHGNDEFGSSDLIGRDAGYRKSTLVDNYVHSVLKTEETLNVHWVDNRLTTACEQGHTLIYDEFNRTPPEANNILLSILEERILNLPKLGSSDGYVRVHPSFRAIFTSNPEEYAGVHKMQDALLDRLITIQVDHYDQQTEEGITSAKSGLDMEHVGYIVDIARSLRALSGNPHRPTIRACIALARILMARQLPADPDEPFFRSASFDVFSDGQPLITSASGSQDARLQHDALLREVFEARRRGERLAVQGAVSTDRPTRQGRARQRAAATED